jgi:hypothetical protein
LLNIEPGVGGVPSRSLLCEAFDGFTESSKTTGMYDFTIKDSRLSLLGATTGGSLHLLLVIHLLLAHYTIHKISDGCDNRFLYHFSPALTLTLKMLDVSSAKQLLKLLVVEHQRYENIWSQNTI